MLSMLLTSCGGFGGGGKCGGILVIFWVIADCDLFRFPCRCRRCSFANPLRLTVTCGSSTDPYCESVSNVVREMDIHNLFYPMRRSWLDVDLQQNNDVSISQGLSFFIARPRFSFSFTRLSIASVCLFFVHCIIAFSDG
jgi:hypothetical protein